MLRDAQGLPLSGATPAALEDYDAAVGAFNLYRGDPVGAADRAIAAAPAFAMARLFKAHLYALATEPRATAAARAIVDEARALPMTDRERGHAARSTC